MRKDGRGRRAVTAWCAAAVVVGLLSGCGAEATNDDDSLRAVATISIIADFVDQVGGDRVRADSIVGLDGDPHTYEPTPSDARKVGDADIVFRNGLGLERWLDKLIETSAEDRPVVTVTDGLPAVVDAATDDLDPHLWMDPTLAAGYVEAIRDALVAWDPDGAAAYEANAETYLEDLAALDQWMADRFATVPADRRKLVTSHDAFGYLGERYGLGVVGSVWGISTEREPSAEEIGRLVDRVRSEEVPVVFVETTVNPKLMQRVARDAGIGVGEPLYGDALGGPGSGADDYLGMMRSNTERIVAGLLGGGDG